VTTDRRRLIEDALGRSPRTIREIDVGYDFEVAIVDDDWVFRFPRRGGVEEALELEIALLPVIGDWEVDTDLRRRGRFYHRLAPWYEAHYGLFTNQPAHTERGLAGIADRL